jgi:hypothetical protein
VGRVPAAVTRNGCGATYRVVLLAHHTHIHIHIFLEYNIPKRKDQEDISKKVFAPIGPCDTDETLEKYIEIERQADTTDDISEPAMRQETRA